MKEVARKNIEDRAAFMRIASNHLDTCAKASTELKQIGKDLFREFAAMQRSVRQMLRLNAVIIFVAVLFIGLERWSAQNQMSQFLTAQNRQIMLLASRQSQTKEPGLPTIRSSQGPLFRISSPDVYNTDLGTMMKVEKIQP